MNTEKQTIPAVICSVCESEISGTRLARCPDTAYCATCNELLTWKKLSLSKEDLKLHLKAMRSATRRDLKGCAEAYVELLINRLQKMDKTTQQRAIKTMTNHSKQYGIPWWRCQRWLRAREENPALVLLQAAAAPIEI